MGAAFPPGRRPYGPEAIRDSNDLTNSLIYDFYGFYGFYDFYDL